MEQVSRIGFDWYLSFNITDQSRNSLSHKEALYDNPVPGKSRWFNDAEF